MYHVSDSGGEADLIEHLISVFIAVELVSQYEYTHFFVSSKAIDSYNSLLTNRAI